MIDSARLNCINKPPASRIDRDTSRLCDSPSAGQTKLDTQIPFYLYQTLVAAMRHVTLQPAWSFRNQTQLGNLADDCEPGRKFSWCHEYCNSSCWPARVCLFGGNDDNRIRTVTRPDRNKHVKGFYGLHQAAGAGASIIFTNSLSLLCTVQG